MEFISDLVFFAFSDLYTQSVKWTHLSGFLS